MFEFIKLIVGIISFVVVYRATTNVRSGVLTFLAFAIWLRFFLSAFHGVTFSPIVAGLSINALSSIGIVGIGILFLPLKVFLLKKMLPIYVFLLAIVVSGFFNLVIIDLINVIIKWCYFIVLASCMLLSIRSLGLNTTLGVIIKAFTMPVSLLILSILLGEAKAAENDGSTSYVGGYSHEAAFSMVIVSFSLVCALVGQTTVKFRTLLFFVSVALLVFINYRTSMLTVLPLVVVFIISGTSAKVNAKYRVPILSLFSALCILGVFILSSLFGDRFMDIGTVFNNWDTLIKAPVYFSEVEQDLFSARVYLWSQYVYEWYQSDFFHQLLGYGPESWNGKFTKYAHNTYISYLYEYGLIGTSCFFGMLILIAREMFRLNDMILKSKLIGCFFGYLIMNIATMPLWNIEGLITLSLLVGTVFAVKEKEVKP